MSAFKMFAVLNAEPTYVEPTEDLVITALKVANVSGGAIVNSDLEASPVIDISTDRTIVAEVSPAVKSVDFRLDWCSIHTANVYPGIPIRAIQDRFEDFTGLAAYVLTLLDDNTKAPSQKVLDVRQYVRYNSTARPLNYGIGIRRLEVIPYSEPDLQGQAGTPVVFDVEFNIGTPLGFTPAETTANNMTDLINQKNDASDYDIIYMADGTHIASNISFSKRVKLIGNGSDRCKFVGFGTWTINSGITVHGIEIVGGVGEAYTLQNGSNGCFFSDVKTTGKNKFIGTSSNTEHAGLVIDGLTCLEMTNGSADGLEFTLCGCSNFNIRNVYMNNLHSIAGAAHGMRLGSDNYTNINKDIILYNCRISNVTSDENSNAEVHGIYAFGRYVWYEKCWIKDIVQRRNGSTWYTDREAMGGKIWDSMVIDCWTHNGGGRNEEGTINCKNETGRNVYIGNLCTKDNVVYADDGSAHSNAIHGYAITAYGGSILVGNKSVDAQTEKGFALQLLHGGDGISMANEIYIRGDVLERITNEASSGHGDAWAGDNFGAIYNRGTQSTYFRGTTSSAQANNDFTFIDKNTNNICPTNYQQSGLLCNYRFSQSNWCDGDKLE